VSLKYQISCICENPRNFFYLQHLYTTYFDLVVDYFTGKVIMSLEGHKISNDYFLKQKKIFRFMERATTNKTS
jgi:hypothetical protein